MWFKSFLFTLAMVLMLCFSIGCDPDPDHPWEDPAPHPDQPAPYVPDEGNNVENRE